MDPKVEEIGNPMIGLFVISSMIVGFCIYFVFKQPEDMRIIRLDTPQHRNGRNNSNTGDTSW